LLRFCLLLYSATGFSQEVDNRFNVNAGVVGYLFNSDKNQDDDFGYQLGFEFPLTDRLSGTIQHSEVESDVLNSALQTDVSLLHGGINYNFDQIRGGWQPYVGAGVGKYRFDGIGAAGFDRESLDVNAGLKYFFSDNWMGKIEAMLVQPGGSLDKDFIIGASIAYVFGSRNERPAARPSPAPITPDPQPARPQDSDGDGVVDANDRCPNTNRNLAVDDDGCVILDDEQRNQTLEINFDFDQAIVKDEYQDEIEEFADFLREYNNTRATIEGHTDSIGTDSYNQALSERRANAVRNVLIMQYGITASRLTAVGFGESQPVASNNTNAGRAQNRRIEADVSVRVQIERRR
jgi:OmpA-OmpF porin, OOP family